MSDATQQVAPSSQQVRDLADAMEQLLDDMGQAGRSVCLQSKAKARVAFEPFRDPLDTFMMDLDEARRIVKECRDA